ncbi:hypothetical protein N8Z47_02045 [Salibacteraceae bacterium]|jgi:hypothetical protein|nr:hypothetical protein [Salibacteraceae bacterium]
MQSTLIAITSQIFAWSFFLLLGSQASSGCDRQTTSQSKVQIQDYIIWPKSDSNYFRVYEHYEGEWTARMFLNQRIIENKKGNLEVSHYWLHGDSTPINRSFERYGKENTIDYVKQSYFEPNAIGYPEEYVADLLPPTKFHFEDANIEMRVFYDFQKDEKATMNFDAKIAYKLELIPELDSLHPVLVLTSDELVKMNYTDKRENTEQVSYSELIYQYKVGLVRIKQSNAEKAIEYNLIRD